MFRRCGFQRRSGARCEVRTPRLTTGVYRTGSDGRCGKYAVPAAGLCRVQPLIGPADERFGGLAGIRHGDAYADRDGEVLRKAEPFPPEGLDPAADAFCGMECVA